MGSSIDRLANDVFITDALRKRVPKRIDHARARSALLDLASEMVRDPEGVLPRYVDLALQETRASSAGLSLHEEPSFFRWRHTREVTSRFPARNPAFDVTPAELVTAIVTEVGVHRAPYGSSLPTLLRSGS